VQATASGGIAEAVAGKSIQSQEGTEGGLTKPDGKAATSSCGGHWHSREPVPSSDPTKENKNVRWNPRVVIQFRPVGSQNGNSGLGGKHCPEIRFSDIESIVLADIEFAQMSLATLRVEAECFKGQA
jgi:hypothetical protein